jgi:hypothetical protein
MFADGHAEVHKWIDSRTKPAVQKGQLMGGVGGDRKSQPGNPDIKWLQERSSEKR